MFNKREKNSIEKEKKLLLNDKNIKSMHKSKTKRKNGNRYTHVYASWSFVRKVCLQVDLRFAFTLFYR